MWIAVHALGLFCLLGSVAPATQPAPSKNPECPAMHKAAARLEKGIKLFVRQTTTCQVNQHCSGINCTWAKGGFLEVDLHHCEVPIKYHIHIIWPQKGVNVDRELRKGDKIELYKNQVFKFEIQVTELQRTGNTVTTEIDLLTCNKVTSSCPSQALIPRQQICVSMRNCPGYNASSSDYAPCNPSSPPPTHASSTTSPGSQSGSSTQNSRPTVTTMQHVTTAKSGTTSRSTTSTHGPHSTGSPTKKSSTINSQEHVTSKGGNTSPGLHGGKSSQQHDTSKPGTAAPGSKGHQKGGGGDSSDKLSVAAIIGISLAGLFVILIVAGVVVYWKKYHHRTRLRAAYYNDISMHDPLYEDFGPEVA